MNALDLLRFQQFAAVKLGKEVRTIITCMEAESNRAGELTPIPWRLPLTNDFSANIEMVYKFITAVRRICDSSY
jgi:hypothetical protein